MMGLFFRRKRCEHLHVTKLYGDEIWRTVTVAGDFARYRCSTCGKLLYGWPL